MCGFKKQFTKPALSVQEQIDLLTSRGLIISDNDFAYHTISAIGYYRFSGYLAPFKIPAEERYITGTSFETVLQTYLFDQKLRTITFEAVGEIEIALRARIINVMCEAKGAHWFLDDSLFKKYEQYQGIKQAIDKETIERKKKNQTSNAPDVISHYYRTYNQPEYPPVWMVFEKLSFGVVSKIYASLTDQYRKQIAYFFMVDEKILVSWTFSLAQLRNLCAHHERIWNRIYSFPPIKIKKYESLMEPNYHFSAQAKVIDTLLRVVSSEQIFLKNIETLIADC